MTEAVKPARDPALWEIGPAGMNGTKPLILNGSSSRSDRTPSQFDWSAHGFEPDSQSMPLEVPLKSIGMSGFFS
jgi:hypothetical protein